MNRSTHPYFPLLASTVPPQPKALLRQGKFPKVYITVIQDLKSMGALAHDLPPGSLVDVKERKAVVPVPALGPSVSRQR